MYKRKAAYAYRRSKRARIMARAAGGAISRRGLYAAGGVGVAALAGYGAYRGIRRIKRARARGRVRKLIGVTRPAACKARVILDTSNTGAVDLAMNSVDTCQIPLGSGRDEREKDVIQLKGWKICVNLSNTAAQPITVNYALISPKVDYNAGVMAQFNAEFFRSYGAERAQDFATTANYLTLCQTPINPDRWNILWRKTIRLGGMRDGSFDKPVNYVPSQKQMNQYIKLNRKMVYESTTSSFTECAPVYLVRWVVRDFQAPGGASQATFGLQTRIVTYFSDK